MTKYMQFTVVVVCVFIAATQISAPAAAADLVAPVVKVTTATTLTSDNLQTNQSTVDSHNGATTAKTEDFVQFAVDNSTAMVNAETADSMVTTVIPPPTGAESKAIDVTTEAPSTTTTTTEDPEKEMLIPPAEVNASIALIDQIPTKKGQIIIR